MARSSPGLSTLSSAAVTVTVCPTDQLARVNVSDAGETAAAVVSELSSATVTWAVGRLDSASL